MIFEKIALEITSMLRVVECNSGFLTVRVVCELKTKKVKQYSAK